jgi:hypothetical protein
MLAGTTRTGRLRATLAITSSLLILVALAVAPQIAAAKLAHGVADPTLTTPGSGMTEAGQTEALDQIGPQLGASYVRFVVSWAAAQPTSRAAYDESYLQSVDRAVALAKADGLKVIITFCYVPKWASDSRYWTSNPYDIKGYNTRYVPKTEGAAGATTLNAFQDFCRQMAERFQASAYECWNEPNLHITLFPQSTKKDPDYGPHVYIKMLRRFSAGIRAADPDRTDGTKAVRIAGSTSSRGYPASAPLSSRRMMTSPQRFARVIAATRGASKYFDAYAHHPYAPGATKHKEPSAAPRDPSTCVNLQNLGTLIKLFPGKPFYLTEYGYQTAACSSWSGQFVSPATQAKYLTAAYSYVARKYPQVKLLMWFLLDDWSPTGRAGDYQGNYSGLRYIDQSKKPSWYAFADLP